MQHRAVAQILDLNVDWMYPSSPMMGLQQKQGDLWAKAVDLSSRIPEDHVLKRLDKVFDLGFVRENFKGQTICRPCYHPDDKLVEAAMRPSGGC